MSFETTIAGLLEFLDWMADKGYAPGNTISSRKAAANKVISSLGEDEAADVLAIEVEDAIERFATKHGQQYSSESLQSYKSRVKTALEDFAAYRADPVGFRPAGRSSVKPKPDKGKQTSLKVKRPPHKTASLSPPPPPPSTSVGGNVVPVPIREDVIVKIGNLPFDLSQDEARKIANVILAYGGAFD
ncbi:hypothetical protein ACI5KX_06025 [Erythrobacter sp. GH1-10]|uniref:hypothetical protein n=1 Tax=Erythrobacter sp. GH1-10 TaxID=3349334 RepID=UPI003877AC67